MADQRVIDYLKQNSGSYPLETLKQALVGQGFSAADIETAVTEAGLGGPPPAPVPGEESASSPGTVVDLRAGNVFSNAKWMVKDPVGYFESLSPESPIGPSLGTTLIWSLIAGCVFAVVGLVSQSGLQRVAAIAQIILFPMMSLFFGFIGAAIFHVICLILGGSARYSGSYAVLASVAALFPVSALLSLIPYGGIPLQIYGLFLSVQGASGVHKVSKKKAWIAFGLLSILGIIGSITAQRQAKEFQQMLQQMAPPGQLPDQTGAIPGIQNQMDQMLAGVDDPEMKARMQEAMKQAAANPSAILQDMARYQGMTTPPQETLSLLDAQGTARLSEAWPTMAAPIRKSLVESLESVDASERSDYVEQTIATTANMNDMLSNSMKMLQGLQQQQGGGQ